MSEPLDDLLEMLNVGDAGAAEAVFVAYEPYLRKVVRRMMPPQMRKRFDSIDIVQSVWGDILARFQTCDWHFTNAMQLKTFLVKITRHRCIDRCRQNRVSLNREELPEALDSLYHRDSAINNPSDSMDATDLWNKLLTACPPEHHDLLTLRRQGFSNAEIGEQLGMHAGSVRRLLRELAAKIDLS